MADLDDSPEMKRYIQLHIQYAEGMKRALKTFNDKTNGKLPKMFYAIEDCFLQAISIHKDLFEARNALKIIRTQNHYSNSRGKMSNYEACLKANDEIRRKLVKKIKDAKKRFNELLDPEFLPVEEAYNEYTREKNRLEATINISKPVEPKPPEE